jgi:hypothetical protein
LPILNNIFFIFFFKKSGSPHISSRRVAPFPRVEGSFNSTRGELPWIFFSFIANISMTV